MTAFNVPRPYQMNALVTLGNQYTEKGNLTNQHNDFITRFCAECQIATCNVLFIRVHNFNASGNLASQHNDFTTSFHTVSAGTWPDLGARGAPILGHQASQPDDPWLTQLENLLMDLH